MINIETKILNETLANWIQQCFKRDASLMTQWDKNLPAMQETQEMWVQSLGVEDPLEKKIATTPVFLPEKPHGQRNLVGYCPKGCKESDTTKGLSVHAHTPRSSGTYPKDTRLFNICKSLNVAHHINKLKNKNHWWELCLTLTQTGKYLSLRLSCYRVEVR